MTKIIYGLKNIIFDLFAKKNVALLETFEVQLDNKLFIVSVQTETKKLATKRC